MSGPRRSDRRSQVVQRHHLRPEERATTPTVDLCRPCHKCKREGTHFVEVEPEGTTKECAQCGVETDKPLWVREHFCPACGFEADRDVNAAWNVLSRGLSKLGVGHSEETPVETVTATDADAIHEVSARHVIETGSLVS
ncbi:hypothetical protein JCM18237_08280 [Halorubrum luteum]